jgi:uncharacterized protein (DUF1810 family)
LVGENRRVPSVDLQRFVEVRDDHARALAEIRAGRKRSHWMWYVFPQLAGLGSSAMAQHYAIADLAEAEAFLLDPRLGTDYAEIVDEVWRQVVEREVSVHDLFGSPDDVKLVSSLTLFAGAARSLDLASLAARAAEILAAAEAQGLARCTFTERSIGDT